MSDEMVQNEVDPTPYAADSPDGCPQILGHVLSQYCEEMLQPVDTDNIRYLLEQLDWPTISIADEGVEQEAYRVELERLNRYREEGVVAAESSTWEHPITDAVYNRILLEWANEGILARNQGGEMLVEEAEDDDSSDSDFEYFDADSSDGGDGDEFD